MRSPSSLSFLRPWSRREAGTHLPCGGTEIDFDHRGFDGDCDVDSDVAHEGIGHPSRSRWHWSRGNFRFRNHSVQDCGRPWDQQRGSASDRVGSGIRESTAIATTVFTLRRLCLGLGHSRCRISFSMRESVGRIAFGNSYTVPISDSSRSSFYSEPFWGDRERCYRECGGSAIWQK